MEDTFNYYSRIGDWDLSDSEHSELLNIYLYEGFSFGRERLEKLANDGHQGYEDHEVNRLRSEILAKERARMVAKKPK